MNIRDVPTGILVTITTAIMRCTGCGYVIYNARYEARGTDEYANFGDNKVRRRFNFEHGNPFCDCTDHIWLSDDDYPYIANGWPIRDNIDVNERQDRQGEISGYR